MKCGGASRLWSLPVCGGMGEASRGREGVTGLWLESGLKACALELDACGERWEPEEAGDIGSI